MHRLSCLVWSLLLLSAAACEVDSRPRPAKVSCEEDADWSEVSSEHFVIKTNADEHAASMTLLALEGQRRRLLLSLEGNPDLQGRAEVILLKDDASWKRVMPEDVLGATWMMGNPPVLILTQSGVRARPEVHGHELVHYLLAHFSPMPAWAHEGFAYYYQTVRMGPTGTILVGEAQREMTAWAEENDPATLDELWAMSDVGPHMPEAMSRLHVSAWAWIHFLHNEHPDLLDGFRSRMLKGMNAREAFHQAFGALTDEALYAELLSFFRVKKQYLITRRSPDLPQSIASARRKLTPPEVHLALSRLRAVALFMGVASANDVVRELRQGLAHDGMNVGLLLERANWEQVEDPVGLARKLVAAAPEDARAWLALAGKLPDTVEHRAERRAALEKALQLAPEDEWSLNELAWELLSRGEAQRALPLAKKAFLRASWNPDIIDTYARALAGTGNCFGARRLQGVAVDQAVQLMAPHLEAVLDRLVEYQLHCLDSPPEPEPVDEAAANMAPP